MRDEHRGCGRRVEDVAEIENVYLRYACYRKLCTKISNERKYLRVVCVIDVGKHIINPNICERAKPLKAPPKF